MPVDMDVVSDVMVVYRISAKLQAFWTNAGQQLGNDVSHPFGGWIRGLAHLAPVAQANLMFETMMELSV